MSSEIGGTGLIVAAVALPAATAFGAGWMAWQAGKFVLETNDAINRGIEEQQRRKREMEQQRRTAAMAGHEELVATCRGLLAGLDGMGGAEQEALRQELEEICREPMPEDAAGIERRNSAGVLRVERILSRQQKLKEVKIFGSSAYEGLAAADLVVDLRLAAAAAEITATTGADVKAADPLALERAELNRQLADVTGRVMTAVAFIVDLAEHYGISEGNQAWFQSCFNGVDRRIKTLCAPSTSNRELKKGIHILEEAMERYEMLRPSLEKEKTQIAGWYPLYVDAARALGEPVRKMRQFKSAAALQDEMHRLQERSRRAQTCAGIYKKLGAAAYMCYAWDEELRAMGYSVHTRKSILELAHHKPEHAKLGGIQLPFYQWDQQALTQVYHIDEQCELQLIVHPDGTTTMQTIAGPGEMEGIVQTQKTHCASMRELYRRLRENWFILYDPGEIATAEQICSVEAWRALEGNEWSRAAAREEAYAGGEVGVRENTRDDGTRLARQK